MVDGLALSVELATKHFSGDGHLQHVTSKLAVSVRVVDIRGAFENLKKKNVKMVRLLLTKEKGRKRVFVTRKKS